MRVAIALTTCDRPAYTERTLLSLQRHNDLSRFVLLQGDDASQDSRNADMGRVMGFELVHAPTERQGHMAALRALVREAHARGCDFYLALQNDQEWVRPFPWEIFGIPGWECCRLYGAMKMRSGPRAVTGTHIMGTDRPIDWRPVVLGYELAAEAHWSPQPCVTKTEALLDHVHLPTAKAVALAYRPATLRTVENVTFHIGADGTPGFIP